MKRGKDIITDFQDYRGPMDTAESLDALYGEVVDPVLRLDLDYPTIPKELGADPTRSNVLAWLKERATAHGMVQEMYLHHIEFRGSSSGNLHVDLYLGGRYKASKVIEIRSKMGDDSYRVLNDSRRALKNPIYLGGYLHDNKWVPGMKEDGTRGNVIARATNWFKIK